MHSDNLILTQPVKVKTGPMMKTPPMTRTASHVSESDNDHISPTESESETSPLVQIQSSLVKR